MPPDSDPTKRTPSTTASSTERFATTRWTVVLAAGAEPSPAADAALAELCGTYWFPLYAFARRQGLSREDAEDAVQGFLALLIRRRDFVGLSSERGRFRAFLLACLKHFLSDQRDRVRALKRGGPDPRIDIDPAEADRRYEALPSSSPSPDEAYDREWAVTLLARVIDRLRDECRTDGRERQFDELRVFLVASEGTRPYADAARALGIEEGTARVAVHRLRKRYRQLLRDEIARTLADPALVGEEMRTLFAAFAP